MRIFNHQKIFFLFLTIFIGLIILTPMLDFQEFISTGDHGRDLHAFEVVKDGGTPYQDFWWVYGPIMPYYYALFYKLFGVSITSILIGKFTLILIAGFFIYLTMNILATPAFAFLTSVWFFLYSHDFFFTYNHIGGITLLSIITYFLIQYIKTRQMKYAYFGLISILILTLIKLNFGATSFITLIVTVFATNRIYRIKFSKQKLTFLLHCLLTFPLVSFLIYFFFLQGLTIAEIRQCLPYLSVDHPHNEPLAHTFKVLILSIFDNINSNWPNRCFAFLIISSFLQSLILLKDKTLDTEKKRLFLISCLALTLFYFLNLHEFLKSGVFYRTFWAKPFSIMLMFIILYFGTQTLKKSIQLLFQSTIVLVILLITCAQLQGLNLMKTPENQLTLDRANIYIRNGPEWIDTVTQTTDYLRKNLKDTESFLALPYDPIYYFLTAKKSPTRETIFFEHINIPKEQDVMLVDLLIRENINWVVISNRTFASEKGLGMFGLTHSQELYKYINENFKIEQEVGHWNQDAGWAWGHSIRILKKVTPNSLENSL